MSDSNTLRVHEVTKGDTLTPLGWTFMVGGKPLDISSLTVTVIIEQSDGDAEQAETSTGVSKHPTATVTFDSTNNWIYSAGHRIKDGDQVVFATSNALPSGIVAATRYFAREVEENVFRVAASRNGPKITVSGAGTGAHTVYVVGSCQYTFTAGNVDTVGEFWFWAEVADGSGNRATFPHDGRKLKVVVVDNGY